MEMSEEYGYDKLEFPLLFLSKTAYKTSNTYNRAYQKMEQLSQIGLAVSTPACYILAKSFPYLVLGFLFIFICAMVYFGVKGNTEMKKNSVAIELTERPLSTYLKKICRKLSYTDFIFILIVCSIMLPITWYMMAASESNGSVIGYSISGALLVMGVFTAALYSFFLIVKILLPNK